MARAASGRDLRIAILGAGPGGICMAIRLKQSGFTNFVVLEKSSQVGGAWNHNRHPGCACDIQSHLYSCSFEIKPDWSRPYAPQPEILEYIEFCAEKYGVLPHCQFDDAVRSARWNEGRALWTLALASGRTLEANVISSPPSACSTTSYSRRSRAWATSRARASTPHSGTGPTTSRARAWA